MIRFLPVTAVPRVALDQRPPAGTPRRRRPSAKLEMRSRGRIMGRKRKPVGAQLLMSDPLQTAEMPKLDTFDEEFGQDPAAVVGGRRRKVVRRLVMLAVVALCAGTIAALAFAWSSADGQLRPELQSITASPRTVAREGAGE